jgi:hypothetical protein
MWLLVRLILAAAVGYARARYRPNLSRGTPAEVDGVDMRLVLRRGKNGVVGGTLVVDVGGRLEAAFRREGAWDRALKFVGLAREFQHGRADFDARVFVECDDEGLARALVDAPGVVEAMMDALQRGARRIWCGGGLIAVAWDGNLQPAPFATDLAAIAKAWRARPEMATAVPDAFAWRALLAEGLLWSLTTWMLVGVFELGATSFPRPASWGAVAGLGLTLALPAYLLLLVAARLLLRGSSHGAKVLTEIVIVAALTMPPLMILTIRDLDMRADTSAASVFTATVSSTEMHEHRGRRGTTYTYHVEIDALRPVGASAVPADLIPWRYRVGKPTYQALGRGSPVQLLAHPGALGLPWIEDLVPR